MFPTQSRTGIRARESPNSVRSEVFSLNQFPFVAIDSESPDPPQVIPDRPTRKMAFSPKRYNCALAIVL